MKFLNVRNPCGCPGALILAIFGFPAFFGGPAQLVHSTFGVFENTCLTKNVYV